MLEFSYDALPGRIVFGRGAARQRLAGEVDRLGSSRLLLIATASEEAKARELLTPVADRVVATFAGVRPHVPVAVAEAARAMAAEVGADALLSVGGGSTTGTAKAVALTTGLPIVALPTTYAGSEVTPVWGLTEGERKRTGTDPVVLPRVVIYDPELQVSLPTGPSAASGLNAMAHCVEAFWAPRRNPISALAAEEGIRALATGLPAVVVDGSDLDARSDLLYGAYLAGSAFAVAGSGLHHKICHVLGGAYDLPHAETHAIVLPHVLAFNAPGATSAAARIGRALGFADPVAGLRSLSKRVGIPTGLRDIGLRNDQLDEAVALIEPAVPADNPVPVTTVAAAFAARGGVVGRDGGGETMSMQQIREQAVTDEVIASFAGAPSERLREVMSSLVRHLHDFAREVRVTEAEWQRGIDFLTRVGHTTTDKRQEFILLSDVLGLSMLTVAINAPASTGATESTVFGPFFVEDAPEVPLGGDIARGAKGSPCYVSGTVRSADGTPLPGARIEVWEADEDGFYDVQYDDDRSAGRAWQRAGADGEYRFWSVLPAPYPIPYDGPVGDLLRAADRSPMRPAHLHYKVDAPGHRTLITHIFVAGDKYLASDAVFGVKNSLIVDATEHPAGTAPDGSPIDCPYHLINFDIVLAPQEDPS